MKTYAIFQFRFLYETEISQESDEYILPLGIYKRYSDLITIKQETDGPTSRVDIGGVSSTPRFHT